MYHTPINFDNCLFTHLFRCITCQFVGIYHQFAYITVYPCSYSTLSSLLCDIVLSVLATSLTNLPFHLNMFQYIFAPLINHLLWEYFFCLPEYIEHCLVQSPVSLGTHPFAFEFLQQHLSLNPVHHIHHGGACRVVLGYQLLLFLDPPGLLLPVQWAGPLCVHTVKMKSRRSINNRIIFFIINALPFWLILLLAIFFCLSGFCNCLNNFIKPEFGSELNLF